MFVIYQLYYGSFELEDELVDYENQCCLGKKERVTII